MVLACAIASCRNKNTKENDVMLHRIPANKTLAELWQTAIQTHQPSFCVSNQSRICNSHFLKTDYQPNNSKILNKKAVPTIFRPTPRRSLIRIFDLPENEKDLMISQYTGSGSPCQPTTSHIENMSLDNGNITETEPTIMENEKNLTITQYTDNESPCQPSTSRIKNMSLDNGNIGNITTPEPNIMKNEIIITPKAVKTCSVTKKRRYMGDFDYEDLNSPSKRRRYWYITQKTYKKQQIKLKNLRKKNQRLLNKIKTMSKLIDHLQEENKVSGTCHTVLK